MGAMQILDTAIQMAEQGSWEALRLHDVAAALHIKLIDIKKHYPDKEALIDAWFERANQAVLKKGQIQSLQEKPVTERLQLLIMAWFKVLEAHKDLTRQMLIQKCEPGHLHTQLPAIVNFSRTIQWIRECAHQDALFLDRIVEEVGLSSIFMMTLVYWLYDKSPHSVRTKHFLFQRLQNANTLMSTINRLARTA